MLHCVRMRLAPGEFMRTKVSGFAKIGRTRILCWDPDRLVSTRIRCDYAVGDCGRCGYWRSDGKDPVKGLIQARDPMLF